MGVPLSDILGLSPVALNAHLLPPLSDSVPSGRGREPDAFKFNWNRWPYSNLFPLPVMSLFLLGALSPSLLPLMVSFVHPSQQELLEREGHFSSEAILASTWLDFLSQALSQRLMLQVVVVPVAIRVNLKTSMNHAGKPSSVFWPGAQYRMSQRMLFFSSSLFSFMRRTL